MGDVHAVPSELDDCWRLVQLIKSIAEPDTLICFLGDQHHTHGLVHLPILNFWRNVFIELGGKKRCIALIGNHDKAVWTQPDSTENVMQSYVDVCMVPVPVLTVGGVTFLSHTPENDRFVQLAGTGTTLVCHQSFDGYCYENGSPIRDGIDIKQVNYKKIISGHIHSPQDKGKVWYPGAPRWRSRLDANVAERFLQLVEHADDGSILSSTSFATSSHCRPIRLVTDTPENPLPALVEAAEYHIDIHGPAGHVQRRKSELAGPGRKIKVFITDQNVPAIKESDGIENAFLRFFSKYKSQYGTSTKRLAKMLEERLGINVE